jgi:hypothetical protein
MPLILCNTAQILPPTGMTISNTYAGMVDILEHHTTSERHFVDIITTGGVWLY